MENNQATSELATSLLLQLFNDYKKEKRRARLYRIIYFTVFLAIAIWFTVTIYSFSFLKTSKPSALEEDHVAVIEITGTLGLSEGSDYKSLTSLIKKAFENESSIGVILDIDSGGGLAYDSHIVFHTIQKYKKQFPHKKVTTFVRSTAASGAYWLAVAGDKIYGSASSCIGSIGVMMQSINFYEFLIEHKIEPVLIHSGEHKVAGSPLAKLTKEDIDILQHMTDAYYTIFTNAIKEARGERLKITKETFSGLVWLGQEAQEMGLIDHVLDFEEMVTAEYGDYPIHYVENIKEMSLKQIINDAYKQLSFHNNFFHNIGSHYGVFA
jgi:protease-4